MSENPDIILVAEFKQILGPAIIHKIPNIPKVAQKNAADTNEALNKLTLKAMSMKFTFDESARNDSSYLPFNDDSYIIMEFDDLRHYTCLWYFTYLPDLSARGFARRIGLAYISPFKEKIIRQSDCISNAFSQLLLCIKYPLCAVYRYETIRYINELDQSIDKINNKLLTIDEDDQLKGELQRVVSDYSVLGLQTLIQQLLDLKFYLLNRHSLLCMEQVPLFFQLFQTETLMKNQIINRKEFATLGLTFPQNVDKILKPIDDIIPKNFKTIVTIPPHELRIQKRQELRDLNQVVTTPFWEYFETMLQHVYKYFCQNIVDLEQCEIIIEQQIAAKRQNQQQIQGFWFGSKLFIPTQINEVYTISYNLHPYQKYKELFIPIVSYKLKDYLQNSANFIIENADLVTVKLPYFPITEHFSVEYYGMFPYIPNLISAPAGLTQAFPQYGHFLYSIMQIYPQNVVKTLITQLLSGRIFVVFINSVELAILLQQALDPFILNFFKQFNRSIVQDFNASVFSQELSQFQLQIYIYSEEQQHEALKVYKDLPSKQNSHIQFLFVNSRQSCEFNGMIKTCSIAEDIYSQKEYPSIFCISRRLECMLRRFMIEAIYTEVSQFKKDEDDKIRARMLSLEKNYHNIQVGSQEGHINVNMLQLDTSAVSRKALKFQLSRTEQTLDQIGVHFLKQSDYVQ